MSRNTVEIPLLLKFKNETWKRGQFLGKGGFAKCYEITSETSPKKIFACKIVPKTMLVKPHQKEKMIQEIHIHSKLDHPHIVKYIHHFEDDNFFYVILELCKRRSLMELVKRRGRLTVVEAQYFLRQLLQGVDHLHEKNIIHRDLKLGNVFLNDEIHLKIGDFGLATTVLDPNDRKLTLCGTPNYIAPEILSKTGHSIQVDMWSIGCILYTLLVGKPPFETNSLKETYQKIKRVEYQHASDLLSNKGYDLIRRLLVRDPQKRLTTKQCLQHPFMTDPNIPLQLPESILSTAPRFDRRPALHQVQPTAHGDGNNERMEVSIAYQEGTHKLNKCAGLLQKFVGAHPIETPLLPIDEDVAADPAATPVYFVSKWVDYTDKYGLGYQLCDNSVAVLFNDRTRMVLMADGNTVCFIDNLGNEFFHTLESFSPDLEKKILLIKYFNHYMSQHLLKAGADVEVKRGINMARLPYLLCWFRTQSAIVLFLSNGTLQLNFFKDHTKIILCPYMEAISYIDKLGQFRTYSMKTLNEACPSELTVRLKYAASIIGRVRDQIKQ